MDFPVETKSVQVLKPGEKVQHYPPLPIPASGFSVMEPALEAIESAITILKMAGSHKSESTQAHLLLARCFKRKGDERQSAIHLKKVATISPQLAKRNQHLPGSKSIHSKGQRA
jgi:hypothetical protein